ncbi:MULTISPECIES: glycoside hydrolase family 127 protein [unclassified Nocardioides]|uniref:glycoside hydrolase family 127 protein n=1 Tax=unclassified Nocardioides TaxID=2615069 RepID=UPI0009F005EB|nr:MULTISPECIES: beta-L-arabinofuranosidase domain-containing protein [unclassified Nocardioides]GAW51280.1 uncharacterized protein PD653B2_3621 [Nocardioides sp. PD653-B2]GAW52627.1 uncharacterized protein PD653_0019 [Nocardioides sp. PD653]
MPMRHVPVSLTRSSIEDHFWSPKIQQMREVTLPVQHAMLQETGRFDALRLQWKPGDDQPHPFWESDVAKWIEAASYVLAKHHDPDLESKVDAAIDLLAGAQQPDGYLNVFFTVVKPGERWTDLLDAHELYGAGHLIEAGVAHHAATGKRTLLEIVMRYADHIASVFGRGPGQKRGYCGHEEIELALVRLYRATGVSRYLELATYFVDERGQQPFYFDLEDAERPSPSYFADEWRFATRAEEVQLFREYNQAHAPVREQADPVGHAVRAMYLYSAMADLAGENDDASLLEACERLWSRLTGRRMYVTGGLGSSALLEGFTEDYDLPDETAYAETCAAIGLVFWAHRMLMLRRKSSYGDILERALYNGVLSGISLDGRSFFYDNPLASKGAAHRHEWFGVACCPPNLARLLTSLSSYVYSHGDDGVAVHLYVSGTGAFEVGGTEVTIRQETSYPWDGSVKLSLAMGAPAEFPLAVRLPGWCDRPSLSVNGHEVDLASVTVDGYAVLDRAWNDGDEVTLDLPMPAVLVRAHPLVSAASGRGALMRGPLVYCVEQVDVGVDPLQVVLASEVTSATTGVDESLGGAVTVCVPGHTTSLVGWEDELYRSDGGPVLEEAEIVAVPYHLWANRGDGAMRVWLRSASSTGEASRSA